MQASHKYKTWIPGSLSVNSFTWKEIAQLVYFHVIVLVTMFYYAQKS